MTDTKPSLIAEQYVTHINDIADGEKPAPERAVLVEFYPDEPARAFTFGMEQGASKREMLLQVLNGIEVLSRVAKALNNHAAR